MRRLNLFRLVKAKKKRRQNTKGDLLKTKLKKRQTVSSSDIWISQKSYDRPNSTARRYL